MSFTIRDNFTASIEDAGDREIVLEALKNVNGSGITSNNPEVNEVIENLRYIQEVLSMELPEIEGEVTVGTVEDILTGDGCNYCLWINGELWSNYTGYEAVENSIRAYHKGKTSVPEFSGREDKAEILSLLTKTLQLTGAGCDIREITYEKRPDGEELAHVTYVHGYRRTVNISADSGTSIIREVTKAIA